MAAVAGGSLAVLQSVDARRESDRAERAARVSQALALARTALLNHEGDEDGSILAAVEAVEVTRRADGIVVPEAGEALAIVLDVPLGTDVLTYEAGAPAYSPVPTASIEGLLELARATVQRPMSEEECRFYLQFEAPARNGAGCRG